MLFEIERFEGAVGVDEGDFRADEKAESDEVGAHCFANGPVAVCGLEHGMRQHIDGRTSRILV